MKFEIDTTQKTVKVLAPVTVGELATFLENLFGQDFKSFKIEAQSSFSVMSSGTGTIIGTVTPTYTTNLQ